MVLFSIFSMMFFTSYQVEPFPGPIIRKNISIKRLVDTKKMTHQAVSTKSGKYPPFHIKQRQQLTDAFGCLVLTTTEFFGNPIMVPKTDSYGKPMIDSRIRLYADGKPRPSSRVWRLANRCRNQVGTPVAETDAFGIPVLIRKTTITNIHQTGATIDMSKERKKDTVYIYVAVGAVTLLLVAVAVSLLIWWTMKKKNQRRVNNADSL